MDAYAMVHGSTMQLNDPGSTGQRLPDPKPERYRGPFRLSAPARGTRLFVLAGVFTILLLTPPVLYDPGTRSTSTPEANTHRLAGALPDRFARQRRDTAVPKQVPANAPGETTRDALENLLSGGDFDAAVALYDRIYTTQDLDASGPHRAALLDHASRLNQDRRYTAAIDLLEAYLALYYADVEALILEARAHRNNGQRLAAIGSLQQAQLNEHRLGVAGLIQNQANVIIGELAQDLRDRDDLQSVTDLYRWLTRSQPAVAGYHIGLARAYAAQHRYHEAVDALRYVQYDAAVGAAARALISEYHAQVSRG